MEELHFDSVTEDGGERCSKFRSAEIQNGASCIATRRQGYAVLPLTGAHGSITRTNPSVPAEGIRYLSLMRLE